MHPAAGSPSRRRARPTHRAVLEHDARPSITEEAPVASEPDASLKAQKAAEWQIPLVDLAFLEALVHPAAASPSRRRARPTHRAVLEHDARPSITEEAPVASEPDRIEAPAQPMVLYDDPVARREQSKLMALVHGEPSHRTRKS